MWRSRHVDDLYPKSTFRRALAFYRNPTLNREEIERSAARVVMGTFNFVQTFTRVTGASLTGLALFGSTVMSFGTTIMGNKHRALAVAKTSDTAPAMGTTLPTTGLDDQKLQAPVSLKRKLETMQGMDGDGEVEGDQELDQDFKKPRLTEQVEVKDEDDPMDLDVDDEEGDGDKDDDDDRTAMQLDE